MICQICFSVHDIYYNKTNTFHMYSLFLLVCKMGVTGLRDFHVRVLAVLIVLLSQVYPLTNALSCFERIGFSLKMSFSNGWFSIKCHSFMRICIKLGTDG